MSYNKNINECFAVKKVKWGVIGHRGIVGIRTIFGMMGAKNYEIIAVIV